jgi:hypothetical protein
LSSNLSSSLHEENEAADASSVDVSEVEVDEEGTTIIYAKRSANSHRICDGLQWFVNVDLTNYLLLSNLVQKIR